VADARKAADKNNDSFQTIIELAVTVNKLINTFSGLVTCGIGPDVVAFRQPVVPDDMGNEKL
jgi:hypothetical protein